MIALNCNGIIGRACLSLFVGISVESRIIDIFPFPLFFIHDGIVFGRAGGGLADARAGNRQVRLWFGVSCELGGGAELLCVLFFEILFYTSRNVVSDGVLRIARTCQERLRLIVESASDDDDCHGNLVDEPTDRSNRCM